MIATGSGPVTEKHGVGRVKSPCLGRQLGHDVLELNQRIKRVLDLEIHPQPLPRSSAPERSTT